MTKFVIALALTIATLTAVPAAAGPYCQEDLGMAEPAASAAAGKWLCGASRSVSGRDAVGSRARGWRRSCRQSGRSW